MEQLSVPTALHWFIWHRAAASANQRRTIGQTLAPHFASKLTVKTKCLVKHHSSHNDREQIQESRQRGLVDSFSQDISHVAQTTRLPDSDPLHLQEITDEQLLDLYVTHATAG